MCWQVAIPLLASAAGSVVQHKAASDELAQRDRITAQNIMTQAAANREAGTRVSQTTSKIAASNPDDAIKERRAAYVDALRRAQPQATSTLPGMPGASQRFAEDVGTARNENATYGADQADTLARVEAPNVQRAGEAVDLNDTGTDLEMIANRAKGQNFLNQLRLAQVRPDAALTAGGQLLSGYGSAAAANGGTGFSGKGDVWTDSTPSSGLTAQQRRLKYLGG